MVDSTHRCLRSPCIADPALLEALEDVIPKKYLINDFSLDKWLRDEEDDNWLYYDPRTLRDFAMFQKVAYRDRVFEAHQFFGTHRGRSGIRFGKKILESFFEANPDSILVGLSPVDNRPARWMARQLGFVSHDIFENIERFFLTSAKFHGIIVE